MSINLPSVDPIVRDKLELRRSQQLEFLQTVLESVYESNGNPDIIYPLFHQNLDLLDLDIIEVLKHWANDIFAEIDRAQQKSIALAIFSLGNLIQEFTLGNKDVNMEWSIECYALALEILTIREDPKSWGRIKNNLAAAYGDRIRGDRAENLERSIDCFRAALEMRTPESFPLEWAKIQVSLAQFSIEHLRNYQVATEHLQSAYAHLLTNNNETQQQWGLSDNPFDFTPPDDFGLVAKIFQGRSQELDNALPALYEGRIRQGKRRAFIMTGRGFTEVLRQAAMQRHLSIDLTVWQTIWPRIQASVMQEISPRLQRLLYVAYEQKGLSEDISNATLDRLEARTFTSIIPEIQQLESMDLMMRVEDERGVRFVPSKLYLPPADPIPA
jgi:tetratricopeptide (TPR) repeat protein